MADYYRDVIRYLRDAGYEFKRSGRGDHEIWWDAKTGQRSWTGSFARSTRPMKS
jgi:hypothetical protein